MSNTILHPIDAAIRFDRRMKAMEALGSALVMAAEGHEAGVGIDYTMELAGALLDLGKGWREADANITEWFERQEAAKAGKGAS